MVSTVRPSVPAATSSASRNDGRAVAPVGAGDGHGLHVVGGELHRVRDPFTAAVLSADGQHRQGQPPSLALRLLRDGGIERPVPSEAAAQGVLVGSEDVDVVVDGVVGSGLAAATAYSLPM